MNFLAGFIFLQFVVILVLAKLLYRANDQVIFYRYECAEWQVAAVQAGTLLVLAEQGEDAMKGYKAFARYNQPELVRESLPHPQKLSLDDPEDPEE